jgi:dolichol-phosphate mannosyltransferase
VEALVSDLGINHSLIEKTYVVLPAYNEEEALSTLIPKIIRSLQNAQRPFEILIVNDGSKDQTSHRIKSLPPGPTIRELQHETNQGYGAALRTAFLWVVANAQEKDAVVTLDADNTQDPIYIPQLLTTLEEGFDAVTASYTRRGGHSSGVSFLRRSLSGFLNGLFRLLIPLDGVTTYTNGFRAYRVSILKRVYQDDPIHLINDPGFPGGTELFLKVAGKRGKLTEIPFDLHYEHRGSGSKIRLLSTIRHYLRLVISGRRYAAL